MCELKVLYTKHYKSTQPKLHHIALQYSPSVGQIYTQVCGTEKNEF